MVFPTVHLLLIIALHQFHGLAAADQLPAAGLHDLHFIATGFA
jgi:hypothetical protein